MANFFDSVPASLKGMFATEAADAIALDQTRVDNLIPVDNLGLFEPRTASAIILPDGAEVYFKIFAQPGQGIYQAEITRTETDGRETRSQLKLKQVFDGNEGFAADFEEPTGPHKHNNVMTPAEMSRRLAWRIREFTLDGQDLVQQGRLNDACSTQALDAALETFTAYKRAGFPNRFDSGVSALPGPIAAEHINPNRRYNFMPEI